MQLADEQKKAEENMFRCIQDCKGGTDTQINRVMEAINHVVDKLATSIQQLQSQFREQKQVTDWVKKEYSLRPIRKAS